MPTPRTGPAGPGGRRRPTTTSAVRERTRRSTVCPRCRGKTAIINYPEEFDADEEVRQPFKEGVAAWEETGEGMPRSTCGAFVPVTPCGGP
ncbi:hypothetical protein GCM10019016_062480 [Streptomyces prasinosporus]|uniref:Uncharacterized protein n=1 Tax=Streptomyces prasinosporus TaxID=68256 RepID=A0ABP6TXB7_9ACTN